MTDKEHITLEALQLALKRSNELWDDKNWSDTGTVGYLQGAIQAIIDYLNENK